MDLSARVPVPTLWDLAVTVIEEVEKVCQDEDCVLALSREILVHIIQTRVRNMEVIGHNGSAGSGLRSGTAGG